MVPPPVPAIRWQNLHILRVVWTAGMLEVIQFRFMFVSFLCVMYVRAYEQNGSAAQQMDKCRLLIHPASECCWVQQRLSPRWWTWGCQQWGSCSRHSSQLMSTSITAAAAANTEYLTRYIHLCVSLFQGTPADKHGLTNFKILTVGISRFSYVNPR